MSSRQLLLFSLLILAILPGCARQDALDRILADGELRVATRNGPTTYFQDKGQASGFEYTLSQMFANELGVTLTIRNHHGIADILEDLRRGDADLAAAGLALNKKWGTDFVFSKPYDAVKPRIVYITGTQKPRRIEDLVDEQLLVLADSHHVEILEALRQDYPELSWREVKDVEALDLMEMVSAQAPFALINSNEFTANHSYFPKLRIGFTLELEDELAWFFPARDDSKRLQQRANIFLKRIAADGTLNQLKEQMFGHAWGANPVGSQTFTRRMKQRLPKYERLIREVAQEYQLDWHLLAAIAYQESHWNPHARSPTGVRGMMMLTQATAAEMDIADRLDPAQSLRGGARYFKKLRRRLPEDIEEPDRTWMTLAAYNIGRGHLEDARVITERQGGDPHLWKDVRERLPLLQKSKYYKTVRHGYARGSEPVVYVKNIRSYYDIMAWQDIARNRPLPPISTNEYLHPILQEVGLSTL